MKFNLYQYELCPQHAWPFYIPHCFEEFELANPLLLECEYNPDEQAEHNDQDNLAQPKTGGMFLCKDMEKL